MFHGLSVVCRLVTVVISLTNTRPDPLVGIEFKSYTICDWFSDTPTENIPITVTFECDQRSRIIIVQLPGVSYLEICEFEVFGMPI